MYLSRPLEMKLRHFSLLSSCAAYLRENVARRSHAIGTVLYPQSFTVRELKHSLHAYISMHQHSHGLESSSLIDAIISSLELQAFFYNGSWRNMAAATDDDVCIFLYCDGEEIPPRGVFPPLSKCYSPTCEEPGSCYSPTCPNRLRRHTTRTHSSNSSLTCYSPTCEKERGCYSSTCPFRYSDVLDDPVSEFPVHGSPLSSNGPPTPTHNDPVIWIGPYPPCSDRPRLSLSYLMGFATEEALTDFWIGTPRVQ